MSKNKGQLLSWLDILYKKYACYLTKITVFIKILQPYLFSGGINGNLCEEITTFCNIHG